MNIDVTTLLKTLSEYNPSVDTAVIAINKALLVMGNILLSIFLMLELLEWNQLMRSTGKQVPMKFWIEIAFKYVAVYLLVQNSANIMDGFMWLLDAGANLVVDAVDVKDFSYKFSLGGIKGVIAKTVFNIIGGAVTVIANLITLIVNLMRYMELYFLKAIAPILLACMMNNTTRPIAINFFKYFSAYVLIALGLTVVGIIYPVLFSSNIITAEFEAMATGAVYGSAIISIVQGVIYIATILGVSRKMRQLLGV
ncbi:TPA: hypothetical protein TXJ06_001418 [Streptococcus suis]|nr:hypothetical protein [Streptococcus suis]